MKTKKFLWGLIFIALFFGAFRLYQAGFFSGGKEPIYIAVTVPGESVSKAGTQRSINSIQMYLDTANAEGGVNGHPLRLIIKEDGGTTTQAESVANEIIQEEKAMIVLGNGYSDPATAIGKVFAENHIPAITAGATAPSVTEGNDWFFRVVNDNTSQGEYIAEYAKALFGYQTAAIIYEDNAYGESLASAFADAFTDERSQIIALSPILSSSEALDNDIKNIFAGYPEMPDMLFLATYKTSGAATVASFRKYYPNLPIFGGDDLGDTAFATRVSQYLGLESSSNLTDGIYAASPLIFDIASADAQVFRDQYTKKLGEAPTWFSATSYDSALVAVEAMRAAGVSGNHTNLEADRQLLRDYLHSVNSREVGFSGISGTIYFDKNHNFTHPMAIGTFEKDQFISAPIQFHAIPPETKTSEYAEKIKSGTIVRIGDQFLYKTRIVYVGIDINEFDDVDVDGAHTYLADFYLWFRYEGEELNFEDIIFDNSVEGIKLDTPIEHKNFGDIHYTLFRIRDTFRNSFDLSNYPFDHQLLHIKLRHQALERKDLIFVTDILGIGEISQESILLDLAQAHAFETTTDWKPVTGYFYADSVRDYGTRGDPTQFEKKTEIEHSRFNAAIEIQRDVVGFTAKTMMPVFWIILLAYLGLYLPGREFETITGLMTGTVLSVVFFHVDLSGRLNVGYTVALDYVFYIIYALLATELFLSIIAWHKSVDDSKEKSIKYIFWAMRVLYPVVLIGVIVFSIVFYDIRLPGIGG